MAKVTIYTDGGYHPKYKTGSFAYIIEYPSGDIVKDFGEISVENSQQAELYALEMAIKMADSNDLCIYTDYQPVIIAMNQANCNPVFDKIKEIVKDKDVQWHWVHGHSEFNEVVECDKMCSSVFKKIKNMDI